MEKEMDNLMSISQVSACLGLPQSTIRFYEKEFASYLNVPKTSGGHRRFRPVDVEKLQNLHHLIHEEKRPLKEVKETLISDRDPSLLRRDLDLLLEVFERLISENIKIREALENLGRRILAMEESMKHKKRFKIF